MGYTRDAWARGVYAATSDPTSTTPGQLPPPIPGSTGFSFSVQSGTGPWAYRGWTAGGVPLAYLGGGVLLTPLAGAGVMRVAAWWPDAQAVQVVRLTPDGSRRGVRGAYPLAVTEPTRRNAVTNPGVEAGLNGYVPGTGNPTLTRPTTITTLAPAGTDRRNLATNPSLEVSASGWSEYNTNGTVARAAMTTPSVGVASAGSYGLRVTCTTTGDAGASHTVTSGIVPGESYTASAYVQPSTTRDVRLELQWRQGGPTGTVLATDTDTTPAVPAGEWTRVETTRIAPTGADTLIVSVVLLAAAVNDLLDVDAVLAEQAASGAAAEPYFDGDAPGGTWSGTVGESSSTLTVVASVPGGSYTLRATIAAAGTCELTIPTDAITGTEPVTVALDLQVPDLPTAVTVTLGWTDSAGAPLTSSTASLDADARAAVVDQYSRHAVVLTPPAGAASTGSLKLTVDGLPAGGTVELDQVTMESGVTDGSVIDGAMVGGTWTGTPHLSASLLAPVLQVDDGECPLDVPMRYEVYHPALTGGRVRSDPATLDSRGQTWLTHPATPDAPRACVPTTPPQLTRAVEQGVFRTLGRKAPVVISGTRSTPSGTLELGALSWAERDVLLAMLEDGSPLLMRAPAEYGYGPGWWIAVGDVGEDPQGRTVWQQTRILSVPFQVVDGPDPAVAA
ncbi:hypothetical protein GCM10012275_52690 [Longimycelium tulufanense]|uniref:CBM-cenC domain-containing protein n=1 Tax=Longimycelium tulufanense TaxID=907463 RepID=A0A8J3CCW2_9PSEU|nr:carbohydrate binding domain-containing protein [Longimycelium tulufanense]GGM75475.1 hypothetical protein GCM10012275_52690 [Longimycelium tulufanense]